MNKGGVVMYNAYRGTRVTTSKVVWLASSPGLISIENDGDN